MKPDIPKQVDSVKHSIEGVNDAIELEHPTKTTKRINKLVVTALVIVAICLGIILSWALSSDDVLEVKEVPIPTRTIRDHPTAGGVVILNVDYCKKVEIEGTLRVSYVSATREVFLPIGKERAPKGCQKIELPILIPKDIPADTYEIKLRAVYNLNPLRQGIVEEFKSSSVVVDPTVPTNDR